MPCSTDAFNAMLFTFLKHSGGPVLDIGPGMGKMGRLARQANCGPVDCLEVYEPYVEQFGLKQIYDNIEVCDVMDLMKQVNRRFGTVIFGDVLEHLPKSQGRDLLEFLVIRSSNIIVLYPVNTEEANLFQGTEEWDNPHEAHLSVWSAVDFHGLDTLTRRSGSMRLVFIRGYQSK